MVEVNLPEPYSAGEGERAVQFMHDFEARVRSLAPVISVAAVSGRPMSPGSTGMGIVAAERPDAEREIPWASWRLITQDYFKALGVPLQRGRTFDEHDVIAKPWRIIVSQRLAERLWPGENPVGRQAILWRGQGNRPAEVIGVVGDMRERDLSQPPTLAVYLPAYGSGESHLYFAIHTRASVDALTPMLRTTLSGLDPDLPLGSVQTLEEIVQASTASRRFNVVLLSAFAAIALALALVGIFGVTSYSVSRQTAEIGVRLALGASHRRVFRDIVLHGMKPVVAGVAAGGAGALLLAKLMASLLFGVTAHDPVTYATVAMLLMATAVVACIVPALQAMRVDVIAALRGD
jgi:predicted permease